MAKVDYILPSEFTKIETYEDCPCDVPLVVWTGDSWDTEHVVMCGETGAFYPANGVEFTHYAVLPEGEALIEIDGVDVYLKANGEVERTDVQL